MKVLITSTGEDLNDQMDEHFGRAQYFIVYNTQNDTFEAIKNIHMNDKSGAGVVVSRFCVDKGVNAVISGSFGPNAKEFLNSAGIKLYSAKDRSVLSLIKDFKDHRLKEF